MVSPRQHRNAPIIEDIRLTYDPNISIGGSAQVNPFDLHSQSPKKNEDPLPKIQPVHLTKVYHNTLQESDQDQIQGTIEESKTSQAALRNQTMTGTDDKQESMILIND